MINDDHPRSKNGNPPQTTTGDARASWIQTECLTAQPCRQSDPRNHLGHREQQERNRQSQADPEPPRHVDEFGIGGLLLRHHGDRFEGHPADRARARTIADDLRVHGAGVRGSGRSWFFQQRRHQDDRSGSVPLADGTLGSESPRIAPELLQAVTTTEVIGPAIVFERPGRRRGNDLHAADGVLERVRAVEPDVGMGGAGCVRVVVMFVGIHREESLWVIQGGPHDVRAGSSSGESALDL